MLAERITFAHFCVSSATSLPKASGAHRHGVAAEFLHAPLQLGIGKHRVHGSVELRDDVRRHAVAMNSARSFTGTSRLSSITLVSCMVPATGTLSRMKSNGSFS